MYLCSLTLIHPINGPYYLTLLSIPTQAVLVQRSMRAGANEDDEATTSADLTKLVDAINAR